jgi:hypothetical protein
MKAITMEEDFFADLLNPETAHRHIAQGSDEWDEVRRGRFTSSDWWRLMDCGKRPMTEAELKARPKTGKGSKTTLVPDPSKMSPTGIKYIRQKVWETLTGQNLPQAYAYPLVYGKETEPIAAEYIEQRLGVETRTVGFQVFGDYAGGSPDRLIGEDEGLEIKCPSSDVQIDYLILTDHYDLKNNYPDHYWQCVSLMLFTNRKKWHFCTFDPRMKEEKHKLAHVIIEWHKVEEDIDAVMNALQGAVEEKLKLLKLLQ